MDTMAAWRSDINRILHVFNVRSVGSVQLSLTSLQTELTINTHVMVLDIHRNVMTSQGYTDGLHRSVSLPPPINDSVLTVSQIQTRSAISNTV